MNLKKDDINTSPVRLCLKRPHEFNNPHRLTDKKVIVSKLDRLCSQKQTTKGLYGQDPGMRSAIKTGGELRSREISDLFSRNPALQQYLKRKKQVEDRQIKDKRTVRKVREAEIIRIMEINNRNFL